MGNDCIHYRAPSPASILLGEWRGLAYLDNNCLYTLIFSVQLPETYTLSPTITEEEKGIRWDPEGQWDLRSMCVYSSITLSCLRLGSSPSQPAESCHGIPGLMISFSSNEAEAWGRLQRCCMARSNPSVPGRVDGERLADRATRQEVRKPTDWLSPWLTAMGHTSAAARSGRRVPVSLGVCL